MIGRDSLHGERLKVGNLNELKVLIDRSETHRTEVAMNFWKAKLNGPPHSHAGKEQVFYITEGTGVVRIGAESHSVKPGSLVYIPEGVIHQSITGDSTLTYFLFNAFLEPGKEGCASYAEHIEQVKAIRQQQADTGKATSDPNLSKRVSQKKPCSLADARNPTSTMLVSGAEADGCEVERVEMLQGATRTAQYGDREQTIFVLSGSGTMNIGSEECELKPGAVAFIAENQRQTVKSGAEGLTYLSLSTFINPA